MYLATEERPGVSLSNLQAITRKVYLLRNEHRELRERGKSREIERYVAVLSGRQSCLEVNRKIGTRGFRKPMGVPDER